MTDPAALPVLIVGAGPTGLVLALSLARQGVRLRIVAQADGPGTQSRAMGVHARTLEFYRQFGFADEVVSRGIVAQNVHFRSLSRSGHAHEAASFNLGDLGAGLSPYPFMLVFPQDDHEAFLLEKLAALGVKVEWRTQFSAFTQDDAGVRATLECDGRSESADAHYLVGCDGARSAVRHGLNIGFSGGTYEQLFYVADVRLAAGFDHDLHANLGAKSFVIAMPARSSGTQRLIGLVPPALSDGRQVAFDDIRGEIEPMLSDRVAEVVWFSTYRVHHRVADSFGEGRVFLAGDAGHVHSPTGGQGMNTGIGDAVNLGWKLAQVLQGRADASILATYEAERIPFARRLVATTDRAFDMVIGSDWRSTLVREWVAPALVGVAARLTPTRRLAFRALSQIATEYRDSPLSEGGVGELQAGDRLPWVAADEGGDDNFAPLRSLAWQMHVYGEAQAGLEGACKSHGLPLHVRPWSEPARKAGLQRDAPYLVRPDGYLAMATATGMADRLAAYVERFGLVFA